VSERDHIGTGDGRASARAPRSRGAGDHWPLAGLQHAAGNRAVQRLVAGAHDELDGDAISARIGAAEANGRELEPSLRGKVADVLGADPGPVRVHTDAEADELSRTLGATAFTSGRDVFFGGGTFDPATPEGFSLLVHESTHVLQQAAGPVAGTATPDGALAISDPGDSFEQAASSVAKESAPAAASDSRSVQRDEGGGAVADLPANEHIDVDERQRD
jgi:hypothetical protein